MRRIREEEKALGAPGGSLPRRLLLLAAAGIVPLAAMAGFALSTLLEERRAQAERAGLEVTRALATAVDVELSRSIAVLKGISIGPALDTGDFPRYREAMRRLLETRPDWVTITLADVEGRQVANTRRPYGEPLPMVLDLPSHHAAVRTREPVIGVLTKGPAGDIALPVRVPVVRQGEVRYVLTAALKPDTFVEVLNRQRLPADWVVSIFDSQQQRVARSRRHEEFLFHPPSPSLRRMMERAQGDEATGVTEALEGDPIYTAFTRSRGTGWSVAIGIPTASLRAAELRSLATYGGGLLLSLALAVYAALVILRGYASAAAARDAHEAEREQLLQREQEARAAAEAASRSKDEFLAMLGHELRNPLGALSNASWLLRTRGLDPQAERKAREIIARQIAHLARLTDDLLDTGRAVVGKIALQRGPLDLAAVVASVLDTLQGSGQFAAHRLRRELREVWIDADFTRVEQIVTNLVGNALKYTPPGGAITVRAQPEGSEAVLAVSDAGIGMPAELVPRVFEPFVQGQRDLDRSSGGLGIGLTLVRRLAELHGGTASAASAGPGCGSEFQVRLPAIEAPAEAAAPAPEAPAARQPRDILIVEDNEDAAATLRDLLALGGHRVRVAHDGEQALAAVAERVPEVALIDIGLPLVNGYEVAKQMRNIDGRRAPFLVALTGYGLPEDRSRALAAGFHEHLVKPVDPAKLEVLLARASA